MPFVPRTYNVGDRVLFRNRESKTEEVGDIIYIDRSCGYNIYKVQTTDSSLSVFNHEIEGTMSHEESEFQPRPTMPSSEPMSTPVTDPTSETESERFKIFNLEALDKFKFQQENQRTVLKTIGHVKVFQDFLKAVKETRPIHTIQPNQLDPLLCQFFVGLRKENGEEYEPAYLRNIQGSLERHLRARNYAFSITRSFEFHNSRQMLVCKQKDLRKQGKGNGPKTARAINDDEVDLLYQSGQLGTQDAQSILNFLWWTNSTRFGMRVVTEHHNLKWGDIVLGECPVRGEYIEYTTERQTKTRTGADPRNVRDLHPKAFATNDEKCPVNLYKSYAAQRPVNFCDPDTPFYLAKKVNPKPDQKLFQRQALGANTISSIMKNMTKAAGISDDKLTNTSARKHLLQKLNDCGVPPTHIMQISGHKNVQSINKYSKLSDNQQLAISNILSNNEQPSTYLQSCQSESTVSIRRIQTATSIENTVTDTPRPASLSMLPATLNFLHSATITGNVHITVNNPTHNSPEPETKRIKHSSEVVKITSSPC